ncbi:hypothetical protein M8J77_009092 [Diaphorina citri]|nr:hypothetical protein M8J77_009092 [Diaphorina citri]
MLTSSSLSLEKLAKRGRPDGHPTEYQQRATLLNFSDPLGTGTFNVLLPHPQMPDRKTTDCNRTIALSHEQPRALITSPGFPRAYPDNAKCNTLISALPGYRVVLHFEEFVFEPEPHCSYDYLIISEDNVTRRDNTRRLCGDWSDKLKLLRYVSKTAQVRLTFISDYSHHYSGFKARISMEHVLMECADSRLHMFNTSCYLFVSYPQVTWYTASDICRGLEGELASIHSIDEHRFIVSKLRESKEYSTSAFYWMGGTLDRHNKWKWIDNTHMDFTAWLPKSSSYVVLDGQSSSCLSIQWMLSANPLHSSGLYWSPQRCHTVGGYVCKKENLENPVNANTSLTGTEGFITSPAFPSNYANNLDYWVTIRGPEETRIVLAFLRLDLEPQSECLYDYVEMYHAASVTPPTRLCGNHHISALTQLNFVSENNEATLRFHSDYSVSASGFSIQWRAVDVSGCPIQLLTAREGVIFSPNYPHFLLAHLDCTFTVLAPAGRRVWLEIVDYNLEDVYDQNLLQEASLDISLGAGTPSFRPYANRALLSDGAFLSFGERLELRLRTGASPSGRGFKANYKIVNSVSEERVVHLFNGTGMILRHLNFPAPPPGLSVSYNQRLVAPLGYCIQLVFYQTMPALCMDLLDTGPGCGSNTNGSSTAPAYLEVKDSYAELNGTWWKLCEAQGGYAPPMTIVSYLNSIHVRQLSAPGSPYGMRLNVSVSLRVDYNYKSKLLRGSSETGVESCQPNPCQNGGKCFSNGAKSFCQCVGHYTGMLCALTMCELEPCLFGSCELTPIGYKCHCQEGYRGVTCDVRIRPCDNSPCNGHGQCVEKSDRRYVCRCYAWWKGENCSERILHIPQTPLAERMLQEPFWLGLITVTVVLLVLGMFWCARRHFPDKLEKLLAEENERSRHHYPSSSSRSHLGHSHHHCVHSHACSHPMGSGHIPVPTTGTPSPRKRRNNSTPTKNKTEAEEIFKKLVKKPSSDDSNIQETCFSIGSESDIVRPLTLAACSADSILAMFRNFSSSLPSHNVGGGGGVNRSSALVSATTSPTCTSPQASDDSCTPYSSSSNLMESPTFGSRKPTISIQVPVMDQKSMNTNPGPTILLEVPSSNKGGLSPIHEVPTPALTPVMQRHSMNSGMSDNSDVSLSSGYHPHHTGRRPHQLIIPTVTIESPSPTSSSSPKFPPPHLLGSPPPHRSNHQLYSQDFESDNLISISQYGNGPPVITVTGTMSEAESDDTEVCGKGRGGSGGGGGTSSEGTGGGGGMCYLSPYTLYSRGASESGYSSMASPASSRCGSNNPLCPSEAEDGGGTGGAMAPGNHHHHRRPSPLLRTCRVEDPEPGDQELSDDCTMSDNQSNDEGFATDHVDDKSNDPTATSSNGNNTKAVTKDAKGGKDLKTFLSPGSINMEDTGVVGKKSLLQLPTIVIDADVGGFGGGSPVSSRSESPLSDKTSAGGLGRFNPMFYGRLTDSDGLYDCPSPDCCKTARRTACRKKERRKGGAGECRTPGGGSDRGGGGGGCRCGSKPSPKRRVRSHPHITSSSSSESISLQRHRPLKHHTSPQAATPEAAALHRAAQHFQQVAAAAETEASSEDTSEDITSDILRDTSHHGKLKKVNRLRNFGQHIRLLTRSGGVGSDSRGSASVNIPLLGGTKEKKDRHSCEEPLLGRERDRETRRTAIMSRTHTD